MPTKILHWYVRLRKACIAQPYLFQLHKAAEESERKDNQFLLFILIQWHKNQCLDHRFLKMPKIKIKNETE